MRKSKFTLGQIVVTLSLLGCAVGVALADTEIIPFAKKSGTAGTCPGAYTGTAKMTNSAGSIWITPPTNTTSGTFTDASGFSAPYTSVTYVLRKSDSVSWCGTNTVNFPATNSEQYQLTVYVKNTPPPPTNGQSMNLQIQWH